MKKILIFTALLALLPVRMAADSTTETYYMLRAIEAAKSGDDETAINFLSKELDANPTNGFAHMWTALICAQTDRLGWAMQYAESALKYLPKSAKDGRANMNILLAEIYVDAKDTAKAISYLEQAAKEQPKLISPYRTLIRLSQKKCDKEGMLRYRLSGAGDQRATEAAAPVQGAGENKPETGRQRGDVTLCADGFEAVAQRY